MEHAIQLESNDMDLPALNVLSEGMTNKILYEDKENFQTYSDMNAGIAVVFQFIDKSVRIKKSVTNCPFLKNDIYE